MWGVGREAPPLSAAGDFFKNKCSLFQFLMKNVILEVSSPPPPRQIWTSILATALSFPAVSHLYISSMCCLVYTVWLGASCISVQQPRTYH